VAEYVLIRICEPKREVLTETWQELHKKRRNLCFTRYVVMAINFKVSYMGGTYSTRDGGEQWRTESGGLWGSTPPPRNSEVLRSRTGLQIERKMFSFPVPTS
jgi:hypothetical protein